MLAGFRGLLALLLTGGAIALAQQPVPNIGGTWALTTKTFSATVLIKQTGDPLSVNSLSGDFIFANNPCGATTAPFTGSIYPYYPASGLGGNLFIEVNMNGQPVSFDGGLDYAGASLMEGEYYALSGGNGCISRSSVGYAWIATRKSSDILSISGVRNAASGATGPIAAGEIISIFASASSLGSIGPTPGVGLQLDQNGRVATTLGGVRISFSGAGILGGKAYAPLTFVSAGQINAVVPYEVGTGAGFTDVKLQVEYLGQTSTPFALQLAATAPGIFTTNGTGSGPGAILNHDGTANGPAHPEPSGGAVVLYLTGAGQTIPGGISGEVTKPFLTPPFTPFPLANISVMINGQPASVAFSGEAPGLVAGVLQLNVTLPVFILPGTLNLPVRVLVGGNSTQSVVTVSVQ